jgi:hypothetical protein
MALPKIDRRQACLVIVVFTFFSFLLFKLLDRNNALDGEGNFTGYSPTIFYAVSTYIVDLIVLAISFKRVNMKRKIVRLIIIGLIIIIPFCIIFIGLSGDGVPSCIGLC